MPTHTTKQEKAKCLAYRAGKRCGRIAKVEATWTDTQGDHHAPLCAACADRLNATIQQSSPRGFHVTVSTFGPVARTYTPIS